MSEREFPFRLGDRVAFRQLYGFSYGAVVGIYGGKYRVEWDDGWQDTPENAFYAPNELVAEEKATAE